MNDERKDPVLERLRADLQPPWDRVREQRVLRRIRVRLDEGVAPVPPARSRRVWVPVVVTAAVALGAGAFVLSRRTVDRPRLELGEGTTAIVSDQAEVRVVRSGPKRVVLEQSGGEVAYEVDPRRQREVVVWASGLQIRIVGTVFVVRDGRPIEIEVRKGVVEVEHDRGTERVSAGQVRRFRPVIRRMARLEPAQAEVEDGPSAPPPPPAKVVVPPPPPAKVVAPPTPAARTPPRSGRRPARQNPPRAGKPALPEAAAPAPPQGGPPASSPREPRARPAGGRTAPTEASRGDEGAAPSFESLVDAADVARRRGDLDEAASLYLRALQQPSPSGASATVLFTLAVVEEARGRYASAARRFRAYRSRGRGALTEEALAAEARNWRKSGNETEARAARSLYLTLFPNGAYSDAL